MMRTVTLTLIFIVGLSALQQPKLVIFFEQSLPLFKELDAHFLQSLYAMNTKQCAIRCHVTNGCKSFLFSDKVCNRRQTTHEYDGTHSTTMHGRTCQAWAVNSPHVNEYNASGFPDGSLESARNYCRDPDKTGYLWCYTTDPGVKREPCDIPQCDYQYTDDTCRPDGYSPRQYTGKRNVALSGILCQRWDKQSPHSHSYTSASLYPEATTSEAANYCRDPTDSKFLWCYTMDPNLRFMPCDVLHCSEVLEIGRCYEDTPASYIGRWSTTYFGKICQAWSAQSPWTHSFTDADFPDGTLAGAENFCRDPDGTGWLWCLTTDPNIRRQSCGINKCGSIPCNNPGRLYVGTWDKTYSGRTCQRWDSQTPNSHSFTGDSFYPIDANKNAANNYCRDPNNSGRQWCFTSDGVGSEPCDIAQCTTVSVNDTCWLYSDIAAVPPRTSIRTGFKYFRLQ